jgi:hypothetical protein
MSSYMEGVEKYMTFLHNHKKYQPPKQEPKQLGDHMRCQYCGNPTTGLYCSEECQEKAKENA